MYKILLKRKYGVRSYPVIFQRGFATSRIYAGLIFAYAILLNHSARHDNRLMYFSMRSADIVRVSALRQMKILKLLNRNPLLLFLLSGLFLLRLAIRQLLSLLFHEPPRKHRYRCLLPL